MVIYDLLIRDLPLWGVFAFTVIVVFVSIVVGYALGKQFERKSRDKGISTGSIVAASLGLLAFMLAFTFGIAASRFDTRKQILLDEVNAIGTAYLRSDLLPDNIGNGVRKLLEEYVDLRASIVKKDIWNSSEKIQDLVDRSEVVLDELWSFAADAGIQNPGSETIPLFIESLNQVIDLHTTRTVVVFQYRIPGLIWGVLHLISILSFGLVGFEIGVSGGGGLTVSVILALTFSAVIMLISDLDRPMQGRINVNQAPMIQLQQKMQEGAP